MCRFDLNTVRFLITLYSITLFCLSGCLHPKLYPQRFNSYQTRYLPIGIDKGGGYEQIAIDEDIYKIIYYCNIFTDIESCYKIALFTASNSAIEKGYKYFKILDESKHENANQLSQGNTLYVGNQIHYINSSHTEKKPIISIRVKLMNEKEENINNANLIYSQLSKEYIPNANCILKDTSANNADLIWRSVAFTLGLPFGSYWILDSSLYPKPYFNTNKEGWNRQCMRENGFNINDEEYGNYLQYFRKKLLK